MSPSPRLLLLDSASLYFRAFYGVPAREGGPSGLPTNAVAGFVDMVATLAREGCLHESPRPAREI